MPETLRGSAARVQQYLAERGHSLQVVELPSSTRTASDAAASIGCEVAQIAKSLVFKNLDLDMPVLVIASGTNRVDTTVVGKTTGIRLGKADGNYVRQRTGFAIGGIPPVAHDEVLATWLDKDLRRFDRIWAAAGTPNAVFSLAPADLPALTGGEWIAVA